MSTAIKSTIALLNLQRDPRCPRNQVAVHQALEIMVITAHLQSDLEVDQKCVDRAHENVEHERANLPSIRKRRLKIR